MVTLSKKTNATISPKEHPTKSEIHQKPTEEQPKIQSFAPKSPPVKLQPSQSKTIAQSPSLPSNKPVEPPLDHRPASDHYTIPSLSKPETHASKFVPPRFGHFAGLDAPTVVPSYLSGYTRVPSPKTNEAYAPAVSVTQAVPVHRTSSSKSSSQPSPCNPESNIIQSRAAVPADPHQNPVRAAKSVSQDPVSPVICLPSRVPSLAPGSAEIRQQTPHGIQQQLLSARAAKNLTKAHIGEPVPPATQAESSLRNHLLAPHRAVSTFDYQSQANGTSLNHSTLHDSRHRAAHLFPPHFPINIPTPQNQHKSAKEAIPSTFPSHLAGFQQRQERPPFFSQLGSTSASALHPQSHLQDLQNLSYPPLLHPHPGMINHAPQGMPNPSLLGIGLHPPGFGPAAFGAATSRASSNASALPHHPSMSLAGMYSSQIGPYHPFGYPWPHPPNANPRR